MTNRENYLSLARRNGFEKVPVDFSMCASLAERFREYTQQTGFSFTFSHDGVCDLSAKTAPKETFLTYYNHGFKPGTEIDSYGVAHEPGSEAAFHMTRMYHPMEHFDSTEQVLAYPMPDFRGADPATQEAEVRRLHEQDRIAVGSMQCTVWETAWYMRGMENLMMDMMMEEDIASVLLDRVTDSAILRAESYVRSGVDVLFLGDDIGMQHTPLMSEELYCTWLKPRLKRVIDAARAIKPEVLVFYHSCGFVTPFIPHLIEAGIDVLNPVQPECMDFSEIHAQYGDRLSFHGTIGTQSVMPFGTPDEVRRQVFTNLDIAGDKGGLLVGPTHLLEPEVPVENVVAYIKACQDYK